MALEFFLSSIGYAETIFAHLELVRPAAGINENWLDSI